MSTSITSTTAANLIAEVWTNNIIRYREQNLIFANLVDRRDGEYRRGDNLNIAVTAAQTANQKTEGFTNTVTYDSNTPTTLQLIINQHWYKAWVLEEFATSLAYIDQMEEYTKQGGYAIALAVDDVLAGYPDDFSQNVGTLAVDNTDDDIRRGIQYLDDANAPGNDRVMVLSPAAANNLMSIDRYVNRDFGGPGVYGELPLRIYDLKTYRSTNVEGDNTNGHDNGIFQKEAVALAMRKKPSLMSVEDTDYLGTKAAISVIFGAIETRDSHGVWVKGK